MDRSADGDGPVEATAEGIPQPERRSVRRRLVQSTLFPHKSPENCEQKLDRNCNGEGDDYQAKEYRGSQNNKRTRRGKGKTTPPTRTPKKSKEKSLIDGTPEKNGSSNGKGIGNLIENQDASPPIPNLRLEAKMTAEENSRLFAGKQIHPFFSTWKVSKRCNKTTEVESNYCSAKIKDKSINIGPIHVFERDQDDARPLDWSDWELCEEPFTNSSYSLEGPFSSNFEGFRSLDINEFPCASHPPSTSLQDNASLDQCLYQKESVSEAPSIFSSTPSDAQDCKVVEGGFFSGCTRKSDAEQQTDLLQERTDSSYLTCTNQLEDDRLWTDKYQPKKATEVCGNDESVKLLSEWLCSWQQRGCQPSTDTFSGDVCDRQDADYTCSQSNSDLENNNEVASLKNVLLITGPTGCGKSSAIYACAREEGFKVLEVNASECRNGAVVKQRFGEALESHSIEWSQEIHVETQSNKIAKFSLALPDGKLTPDYNSKMIEMIPISNKDNSLGATVATTTCASKESTIACDREQVKHLILFEDVDITFTEDRGFVSAIQQIAEKAKGPVILTSNSENPVLPASLDRLEVSFMMPSKKELLQHAYMVCSAEKVNIQPHLLEQVVEYCQGDIRKTIMHLQFWFQGKRIRKLPPGREAPRLFGPLMFDPEAGHRALPKMMPWNFPSHLSELVEKDITNSLSMMEEENYVSMEVIEEDFKDKEMQNNSKIHNCGKDSIEAKKEAMLIQNCSDHDCDHFEIPFDAVCDVFDSSGTLVSFSRRKNRRKLNVVMSSDSEDELVIDRVPLTGDRDTNNELTVEADGAFPSHCPSTQNCSSPSTDMQLCFEVEKLDENCSQRPDVTIDLHVKETSIPVDVSCVPESTFVPETQINGGTEVSFSRVYCFQVADTLEEVSVSNEFKPNLWPVETDNLDKFVPILQHNSDMLGSICDIIAESSHEEVEDSQNEHAEAITREYQVMDECSRMDFIKKSKPVEKSRSCMTDLVRESWRKLRDRRTDLRHFVTSEVKDATGIIEFAYGMSNLISEAELLLSKHQTLDSSDVLDAFSWSDEHLQMSTTIARQGFCFYAKELANAGLKMGLGSKVDFTWEMLSTASMMEFGDLVRQNLSSKSSHSGMSTAMSLPESGTSSNREMKSCLRDIIESMVPSRAYMTMKGDAFYEYQSSLGHIARSEASRLSASTGKMKGRRARASRNYLSTGSLMLSPEDISLLGQSNIYAKIPSPSMDATDRTI
ncbi:P-LOOP CONTAINING NUCLEOSIDE TRIPHOSPHATE HYDROLASES SUPERFAMILY PROTEIN [Salix koriyanagi]|uniref:p-LOOP CONTAINING NUCLEOSIDE TRIPHOSPHATE HYDROLASES SUPERFAMILY PROTEIN n=1 Tax=Salix koriyanagi TaxID=2511006 RepID=A0A9Q0SLX8_9ROSI|nr:P-LOOP CONTAINING NUCLEOSIDE TRIPHOSPHATE HYDROLASES SUPERFAMILY PROTEIN [Salix koriyanagi]